ncbi:MAG: hypothetical protein P8P56_13695 [Yoonia sp.]|nr:hypothetical protein [Yoonia sp.]
MSSFMRPEARAALWRWREALYAGLVGLFGLWWAWGGLGLVKWIGVILIALAVILAIAGIQRGRFRQTGKGPGVVQVAERRLAYFGPLDGGAMDIADLTKLELDPTSHPAPSWILSGIGGQYLSIPVNAAGADALFDLFGSLDNIQTEAMLNVLTHTPHVRVKVWAKTTPLLH